jgi:pimeloyl-ACP methyl ester carboxylesterase
MSALLVLELLGCGTLEQMQRQAPGAEETAEAARFYWPYAALAANVYATGGASDRDAAMIAGSPWLREEIAATSDPELRRRYQQKLGEGTEAMLNQRIRRDCMPATQGSHNDPRPDADPTGVCRPAALAGPLKTQAAAPTAAAPSAGNRIARVPASADQCIARKDWVPPVALDLAREEHRWEPVAELQRQLQPRGWSVFVPGLAIDVWRRPRESDDGTPSFEYAIVYRGTEGTGGWLSNFRAVSAFTPFIWDQYHQALQATNDLIRQIYRLHAVGDDILERPRPTRILITAVGHSLGGGLATYVLLRSPEITRVVNFNPSPIDGASLFTTEEPSAAASGSGEHKSRAWVAAQRTLPYDSDERAPHAAIYSLYERGELLTSLVGCHPGPLWGTEGGPVRVCEAVNLSHNSAIRQHDMNQLACQLYLAGREASQH